MNSACWVVGGLCLGIFSSLSRMLLLLRLYYKPGKRNTMDRRIAVVIKNFYTGCMVWGEVVANRMTKFEIYYLPAGRQV